MDYSLIAMAAIEQELLPRKTNKKSINDFLESVHKKRPLSLPLECESTSALNDLLEESIRLERAIVPGFFNETSLRESFAVNVAKNKYCSVNTTAVLQDPYWRAIFESKIRLVP